MRTWAPPGTKMAHGDDLGRPSHGRLKGLFPTLLMVLLFVTGCDRVVEIRLVSEADLTATALDTTATRPVTGTAASPTANPDTPVATAATAPSTATLVPSPGVHTWPTATEPLATDTAQPEVAATRIRFQPAATSAARSGHLRSNGSHVYVLAAQADQLMHVELSSSAAVGLAIWGADGTVLKRSADETPYWQGFLPSSQDYYVQLLGADQEADYGLRVTAYARIRFTPGGTSATVSGPIERLGTEGVEVGAGYLVRALGGQTMRVTVTSPQNDVLLSIVGADGVPLKRYVDGSAEWEGILPSTQDYLLQAVSTGGVTRFTLTVTISPLP